MVSGARQRLLRAVTALLALLWCACFFLPAGRKIPAAEAEYACLWENGEKTVESGASALAALTGGGKEKIYLSRGGSTGEIEAGKAYRAAFSVLQEGGFAELCALSCASLSGLERAALFHVFHSRAWYAEGFYTFTGEGVEASKGVRADELVLLTGGVTARNIAAAGVTRLVLRAEAEITQKTLLGTSVTEVEGRAPYSSYGGAVYRDTAGGRRLIAALPLAERVIADCAFADAGALLAAKNVQELTLAFAGNSLQAAGSGYRGELAYLFLNGENYEVPRTLKRVKILGGKLVSNAFYAAPSVEEVELCGMEKGNIATDALTGASALRLVHCPRADMQLTGFTAYTAPCGCTVYEKPTER